MTDRSVGVPDVAQCDHCPHCESEGWSSPHHDGEYIAVCGSRWVNDPTEPLGWRLLTSGAACYVIEHKNDLIEERDVLIHDLQEQISNLRVLHAVAS